ncbi:aminoglycoside phosphotransferase family protein [Legionella quateirensis]|uniref:Phosphotransferase enzyme family protein n=2 Tax=Legionella TaxID=445 RepID=A0A378P9A3_9GAMM|nr:aminoglycoside phosphotransferase family protein [Legionella quateirensis]KTD53865.1 Phosphotransferase enzyme family protein [Legionella quateirensis]STY83086.1 Predicted phosphotransferase related to Ser/Thr protein kinases [Legionella quateirensis]HAT4400006.1 aminoglycoside phosphotransferase family protein [Legionella pneumophila]HAU1802241.1 aminoglycoside phosphotransferase family protein [Legionella pneumophila]
MNNPHIEWALSALNELGYQLKTLIPEIILDTAWSEVSRFQTNLGLVYLKKVPSALSLEANVILLLQKQFNAPVPKILAHNQEFHCFLMQDAGIPLHDVFKQEFRPNLLIDTMHHYTMLQINSADKINLFLELGIPDWRLHQLPKLYKQLLCEEELLLGDGLTQEELKQLKSLDSKLRTLCDQLASFKVPDTFGHADFHDKNILVNPNTHQTTLIDLGEVVITHPFFSFVNCLHRATEHLKLSGTQYRQLQEACFKNWLSIESSVHLFEIIAIINQCWSIHAVLGEYRLIKSITTKAVKTLCRQGRFSSKLRIWIDQSVVI